MIPTRWRDLLAVVVVGAALAGGALVWLAQQPDVGITIGAGGRGYVVARVTPGSEADRLGIRLGDAVLEFDGRPVTTVGRSWEWNVQAVTIKRADGGSIVLDTGSVRTTYAASIRAYLLGCALLLGGRWWLRRTLGAATGSLVIPLAGAAAGPLLVAPVAAWGNPAGAGAAVVLPALGSALLADAFAALQPPGRRRAAGLGIALAIAGAGALALLSALVFPARWPAAIDASWLPLLLVPLVPALGWIGRGRAADGRATAPEDPGVGWLVAAAFTPAIVSLALHAASGWSPQLMVAIATWVVALVGWRLVARRVAMARAERDLVVAATEGERSRLAAELHDVALQELTMLVRRLDARGDPDGAAMARSVADRLRELCGELHLPILDELGAGPALEWLAQQVGAATGAEVRLERSDAGRPPAGVELAVFRVAQEAISNAVKHGRPPIVVRYAADPSIVSLHVDDAGTGDGGGSVPGFPSRPGHYGLVTMRQRAEQIGATLSIGTGPGGGTRVSLEWTA